MGKKLTIAQRFSPQERAVVYRGDCLAFLKEVPSETAQLVITSPPYNIGKKYERRLTLDDYVDQQAHVIRECARILRSEGSICWQVGNYVDKGAIIPLDTILYPVFRDLRLKMRNRIIWRFDHGLHCTNRFSGRYETIIWFTKSDDYTFHLDPVRVPQKYPGKKYFKGPKAGQFSCNPLGKNPSDVWDIPNVKNNHVEKTEHPCQFPVELVERFVLALTDENDWIFDPFLGVGTAVVAAIRHGRRGAGAEIMPEYVRVAKERIQRAAAGALKTRPMNRPIYDPKDAGSSLTRTPWKEIEEDENQLVLLETTAKYGT